MRLYVLKLGNRGTWAILGLLLLLLQQQQQVVQSFRPPLVSQELGCSPTLSLVFGNSKNPHFYFDPLKIADDKNFSRLRECELKHGRVAMLAVLETMIVPFLKSSLFSWNEETTFSPLKGGFLPSLFHVNWSEYGLILATCGVLETLVFVQRDPQAMPGDYGIGYFGVRDKGLNEFKLISELENGRLAMIAVAIQLVFEYFTGESWDEQWLGYFKHWVQQFTLETLPS